MEHFTNVTIDTTILPRYEEVAFTPMHPNYWKVLVVNLALFAIIALIAVGFFLYFNADIQYRTWYFGGAVLFFVLLFVFSWIGYRKKVYAFRTHDVLFRSGIIATNTIVIPYNRIQHVALHEGLLSRYFGLAKVEVFTAGGSSSDIEIPGIEKEQAENIKQLLMGKIQKQL